MFKSKNLFCAQLYTKTGGSFLKRWKITNILLQVFIHVKNVIFFPFWGKKLEGQARQFWNFPQREIRCFGKKT